MNPETHPSYSPGLAGVMAGETRLCQVDPNAGLLYVGYDANELARKAEFEEVCWLLLRGELPSKGELKDFHRELASQRSLPSPVLSMLRSMPPKTHPMDMLRTGVSMLGTFDPDLNDHSHPANLRKALRLISRVSTLITTGWRLSQGQEPVLPRAGPEYAGHAANFLYSLRDKKPKAWEIEMFDAILILYAEHEFNASTFAARVTASTLSDMYSAITSALGALKGPLHGGANEKSMKMLREIGSPDHAKKWLMEKLEKKEKIMGFGHRVYKKGDSRVPVMREIARDLGRRCGQEQWVPICEKLEEVMEREKHLCSNVDLYSAPVFFMMNIAAELNTPIFACARISGWCAHVIEQHDHNRLIRPRSIYTGPPRRSFPSSQ